MEALSWVGKPRRFTKQIVDQGNVQPVTTQCELRLRSDGVMYYLVSEPVNDRTRAMIGDQLEAYRAARKKNEDTRWQGFLLEERPKVDPVTESFFQKHHPGGDWVEVTE